MSAFPEAGNAAPGLGTAISFAHRQVFRRDEQYADALAILSHSVSRDPGNTPVAELRSGLLIGRVTATKKWAPSIIGVLTSAYTGVSTTNTSMQVSAATATELVRRVGSSGTFLCVGPASAAGQIVETQITYSAVNTSTGVITITDPNVNKIAGSFICPEDGSQYPKSILNEAGYAVRVTDHDGNGRDAQIKLPIGGLVFTTAIVNYPTDTSLIAWIKAKLNGGAAGTESGAVASEGPFKFDDALGL